MKSLFFILEINTDGSLSSRASPYGQGLTMDGTQTLNTGGYIAYTTGNNTTGRISRQSPLNYKVTEVIFTFSEYLAHRLISSGLNYDVKAYVFVCLINNYA